MWSDRWLLPLLFFAIFFFSSRRRHTRFDCDWSSDVCSSDLVLAITAIILALRRRVPGLPAVWLAYIVVLLPVLGIFQSGQQIAADRYTYLAGLGWAILAGAGLLFSLGSRRRGH